MVDVILPADTATLHKHDGTNFAQPVAVQKLGPVYNRNYPEVIDFANNTTGFSEIGDGQDYIDSFTIETYSDAAVSAIKNAVARESSQGLFTLRVPEVTSSTVNIYLVRFFGDPPGQVQFSRELSRRRGFPALHVAEITNIRVLDQDTE